MLKSSYTTESEIPENLKGAYVARDGKYVLDDLSEDHPVIVSKKSALADKSRAVTKAEELQADLDSAKQSSVPRGHVAVTKADSELLEKVKVHGTTDEVVSKLTEHKTLKEETDRRKREDSLREVAKVLSYEPEAFVRLQNLPEFEIREKDGKQTVIAKVKGDNNVITEKPANEFIESSADYAPFLPALRATTNGGVKVHGTRGNDGTPPKNVFEKLREQEKTRQQQQADVHPMFQKIPGRTAAQTGD
jgi:hypothetical protein